jgi:hypothetical protein
MKQARVAIAAGIFCAFVIVLLFSLEVLAAPPRKDICPAPASQRDRQAAVEAACRYFGMESQSWGLHSAFGPNGEVITCIHFTCKEAAAAPVVEKEDCVSFNPRTTTVERIRGSWKIVDGSHWMFDFGNKKTEADLALKIIKHSGMDQSCFVGRPGPSFQYMLVSGSAPRGSFRGEDCVSFNPRTTEVKYIDGHWKIVDGSHWMFDFGSNEAEAREALAIIKKHGFRYSCFVGRPQASFEYLRR